MGREEYRYVYADNIISTGKKEDPILYAVDGIINPPFNMDPPFSPLHDLKVEGTLYVQDFIFGINYNPREKLVKLLTKL